MQGFRRSIRRVSGWILVYPKILEYDIRDLSRRTKDGCIRANAAPNLENRFSTSTPNRQITAKGKNHCHGRDNADAGRNDDLTPAQRVHRSERPVDGAGIV